MSACAIDDERHLLRRVGALIDVHHRARRRLAAADFLDAEIAIARHDGDDRQAVQLNAVERAAIDFPGQHRFLADRSGLAAHDAAACEDLGGARLDVRAADGVPAAGDQRRRRQADERCDNK